jgi:hypothetical protein
MASGMGTRDLAILEEPRLRLPRLPGTGVCGPETGRCRRSNGAVAALLPRLSRLAQLCGDRQAGAVVLPGRRRPAPGHAGKFGLPGALLLANALGLPLAFGLVGIGSTTGACMARWSATFFVILLLALAGAFVGALAGASVKALGNGVEVLAILERTGRSVAPAGPGNRRHLPALLVGVVATWRNREFEALTTHRAGRRSASAWRDR